MEETKVKKLESIDFHTIAITSFDAYMMTTSGTHIETEDLEEDVEPLLPENHCEVLLRFVKEQEKK